jgi:hypothetical protein
MSYPPKAEQKPITDRQEIGRIGNYYGGLNVAKIGNEYGWLIENWDTEFNEVEAYEIIPKYLYDALIKFESEREK